LSISSTHAQRADFCNVITMRVAKVIWAVLSSEFICAFVYGCHLCFTSYAVLVDPGNLGVALGADVSIGQSYYVARKVSIIDDRYVLRHRTLPRTVR
jgi:hypothetical protein